MTVRDWWWSTDGILHASLSSHRCTDATDEEMTVPPALWRLNGDKWESIDKSQAHACG